MPGVKAVAVALLALGEAAHTAVFAQIIKAGSAPGQKLMGVGLMAHIPDHLVLREVKGQVHGHGQLHHPQIGSQMAAGHADFLNQEIPDLLGQRLPLAFVQLLNVIYLINLLQIHGLTPVLFLSCDQHPNQFFQKFIPVFQCLQSLQRSL